MKDFAKTGWKAAPLGEVAQIRPNKKEAKSVLTDEDEVSFVPMDCLKVDQVALAEHESKPLGKVYGGYTYFRDGDVLLAKITPCFENGKLGVANDLRNGIGFGSSEFFVLRPNERLSAGYLYHFLNRQSFRDWAKRQMTGAVGHKRVPKELVEAIEIPLPPLEEQQRIVAVLDEAFEGLARARAHAEANLQNARGFFLSVLRDVFSNDSRKWETDQLSDVLAQGTPSSKAKKSRDATQTGGRVATLRPIAGDFSLTVLRSDDVARKGWKWSQLTDLARLESGHTPSRKHPEYWGGEIPWIGIKDARDHHGHEVHSTLENTNPLGIANSSARVLPARTVCLSRTASVGYVTIMGRDMATSQDFVNWVCSDAILPDFLKFILLAQGDEIRRFASGSVHQTIYFPEVKAFHICHPPVSVQKEICTALEAVRDESHRLVAIYEAKLKDLDDLRQSLLQKAFAGELT